MQSELLWIPALPMVAGALLLSVLPGKARSIAFLVFPLISLAIVWLLPEGIRITANVSGHALVLCSVDRLSRLFGIVFGLATIIGGIYAFHLKRPAEQAAALLYAGGALGVVFAGDYLTLFIFWELMAVSSTVLIWARRTPAADKAGLRYLMVHLTGGSLLLWGILLQFSRTGSLLISPLASGGDMASWLILAGVGLNAAIPPLHAWLCDAYPKATITGAVFLSAFTTKTAVYVLLNVFAGWQILIVLGVTMALYGVVYAVLANDIREILAYHIVSQVGYMVAGAGIGTEMAINGAAAHAFCHILYKGLLFMGTGVVIQSTGNSKLTRLGDLYPAMPATVWLYMIGAFSISGFPLFNGFISKSMVVAAAEHAHLDNVVLWLHLASVGTFLHTGLKLPYFTWYAPAKQKIRSRKPPANMIVGMAVAAFFCVLLGVVPDLLYAHLPFVNTYRPYTAYHLTETTQILLATFAGFWLLRDKLAGEELLSLDSDWFYRRPAGIARKLFVDAVDNVFESVNRFFAMLAAFSAGFVRNPWAFIRNEKNEGYRPDRCRLSTTPLIWGIIFSFLIFTFGAFFASSVF